MILCFMRTSRTTAQRDHFLPQFGSIEGNSIEVGVFKVKTTSAQGF
jgi:hypothetical protein